MPTKYSLLDPLSLSSAQLEAWSWLADHAATDNAFLGPSFVVPAARHLPEGRRARLLVATRSPEHWSAVALVVPGARWRRLPLPALGTWAHDQQGLATPLLDASEPERAARDLVAAAAELAPGVRLLGLDEQAIEGPAARALRSALADANWTCTEWRSSQRAVYLREGEGDPLPLDEPARLRSKRRRLERHLGNLQVRDCSKPDDAEFGGRALLSMELSGWKGRHGTAMAQRAGEEALLLDVVRAAAQEGGLRSLVLMAGEDPVAAQIDLVAGGTWFHWKTSYEEAHAASSPGRLLLTHVLERFEQEGLACWDACTVPDHPVMDRLLPHRRTIAEVAATRGAAATAVVRAGHGARRWRERRSS